MNYMFRDLRADEVDVRIAQVKGGTKNNGVSLLLYKDARCDQNILDEAVGPMNWQRHHTRDNANCIVSIWDKDKSQWIDKEDTGTESYTEKEKGLASDSFKRACFNWGIGRELYTAPFIWIPEGKCEIKEKGNGTYTCYDNFTVTEMIVENKKIVSIAIRNEKTKQIVYRMGSNAPKEDTPPKTPEMPAEQEAPAVPMATSHMLNVLRKTIKELNVNEELFLRQNLKISSWDECTVEHFKKAMKLFDKAKRPTPSAN